MKKYIFLKHTADVKFRAYGKTLAESFSNAALALTKVIVDKDVKAGVKKTILVESEDEKALLYDFLEKFLILIDVDEFLLSSIKKISIKREKNKLKLNADVVGDIGVQKYDPKTAIKAVTYQEMEIGKDKGKYVVQVVLDL